MKEMGVVKEKIRISVFKWEHEKIALKHKKGIMLAFSEIMLKKQEHIIP